MSDKKTFVDFQSKKRDNIFDNYLTKIESFRLYSVKSHLDNLSLHERIDRIELSIIILERTFQDFIDSKKNTVDKNKLMNFELTNILVKWFSIFEQLMHEERFLDSFTYHLVALEAAAKRIIVLSKSRIVHYLTFFYPSKNNKRQYLNELKIFNSNLSEKRSHLAKLGEITLDAFNKGVDLFENAELLSASLKLRSLHWSDDVDRDEIKLILANSILKNFEDLIFGELRIHLLSRNVNIEKFRSENAIHYVDDIIDAEFGKRIIENYEWNIEIKFLDDNLNSSQVFYLNWAFFEGLSRIDGVKFVLDDWGRGSLWTRVKAFFNDETSKQEVKQIIQKSKESLESQYLDKPIEEVEKIRLEKKRIKKETDNLMNRDEIDEFRSIEKKYRLLDIEEKELNIESKHLDNQLKKLEIVKGISELVTAGLISVDSDYQILINEILTIEKKEGKFIQHDSLDLAEDNEVLKLRKIDDDENSA